MYTYTAHDRQIVHERAAQYRNQLQRHLDGSLPDENFRPLRLQNGWYVQRHAPMLRVAVPYGELNSRQLRQLAVIARDFDQQDLGTAQARGGFGHFTTRQNIQFNWVPLERSVDVMDLLADVDMHGIQTSGNCIRNITSDALAGVAADEVIDPRPYCEILRQWSSFHPEFAFLPRKFKIAVNGAHEDRAATAWHDIGLTLKRNESGDIGFAVAVGGGMGRTPVVATLVNGFVPWQQILVFIEAVVRVYNQHGRCDNMYKARIKILVKAEGQRFVDAVNAEFAALVADPLTTFIPQAEFDRVANSFAAPVAAVAEVIDDRSEPLPAHTRWVQRNVHAHQLAGYRAVTLSLKRAGQPPGDVIADQMERAAELADRFSQGELRVTHDQNLLLPWVRASELRALWLAAREDGFATPNIGLLTDMIACPGGDLCTLANAERSSDLDELHDIGDIDLHISGCINSCGHHHSGHIGVLGVDKDGSEWYQLTVGGADGSTISGAAVAGKVIGPSCAADEVPDAIEAVIDTYLRERQNGEHFIHTARRNGNLPFRQAADSARRSTAVTAG